MSKSARLTAKQRQVIVMMTAGQSWPNAAAFVFDTTTAAINSRNALVKKGLLSHNFINGFCITTLGVQTASLYPRQDH